MALESKPKRQAHYHSYLVRIWRDGNGTPWRASLQDAATGERRGFPDLSSLFAYLQAQTGETDQQDEEEETKWYGIFKIMGRKTDDRN